MASLRRRTPSVITIVLWFIKVSTLLIASSVVACAQTPAYVWSRLVESPPFPKSYNYPVHIARDGRFVLLLREGNWESLDGASWTPSALPPVDLNSAYQAYLSHDGATYAFGVLKGNYTHFEINPIIQRTDDHRAWREVGVSPTLPKVVFYSAASFDGAMWIIGGYDGKVESDDVWRSVDGLEWRRVTQAAPFGPRMGSKAVTFRDRLYLIGGGRLDGPSNNDVWSTADGKAWRRETGAIDDAAPVGFTPVVFDDRLWLVGANRSGRFASEMLVSDDGRKFRGVSAPWSPRGGVAVWIAKDQLYLTGGKYSTESGDDIQFIYSNDVWAMRRQ